MGSEPATELLQKYQEVEKEAKLRVQQQQQFPQGAARQQPVYQQAYQQEQYQPGRQQQQGIPPQAQMIMGLFGAFMRTR